MNRAAQDFAESCIHLDLCSFCNGSGVAKKGVFTPKALEKKGMFTVGVAPIKCPDCDGSGHSNTCKIAIGDQGEIQCPEEPPKKICCAFCEQLERCCDKCPEIPLW